MASTKPSPERAASISTEQRHITALKGRKPVASSNEGFLQFKGCWVASELLEGDPSTRCARYQ